MNKNKFLITGHPRCGTGFSAKLMQSLGYDVQHETMGMNGISAWFYAVDDEKFWLNKSRKNYNFDFVFHALRHPYGALNSIARTETPISGNQYKTNVNGAYALRKKYIRINDTDPVIERAAQSYLQWNSIIEKSKPDLFFKIENNGDEIKEFFKQKKIEYQINDVPKKYNTRNYTQLRLDEWDLLKNETIYLLDEFCKNYSYDLLSETIENQFPNRFIVDVDGLKVKTQYDHIGKIIRKTKQFYEQSMLNSLKSIKGNIALDIGANIGNHTLFFSKNFKKVISIEPELKNFSILTNNIELNKLDNVFAHNIALSKDGRPMISQPKSGNMGATTMIEGGKTPTVTPIIFDTEDKIDLIKIDCETMSDEIFIAMIPIIKKYNPIVIIESTNINDLTSLIGYKIDGIFNATPTYILSKY